MHFTVGVATRIGGPRDGRREALGKTQMLGRTAVDDGSTIRLVSQFCSAQWLLGAVAGRKEHPSSRFCRRRRNPPTARLRPVVTEYSHTPIRLLDICQLTTTAWSGDSGKETRYPASHRLMRKTARSQEKVEMKRSSKVFLIDEVSPATQLAETRPPLSRLKSRLTSPPGAATWRPAGCAGCADQLPFAILRAFAFTRTHRLGSLY